MKRAEFLIACVVLLLTAAGVSAQTPVTGRVVDTAGEAVGYATVAVLRGATPVTAAAADAEGAFALTVKEAGDYFLAVTMVGYEPHARPLRAEGKPVDLGAIAIKEGVRVEAVVLTVQRPIVTADAEKLAYSVEDDPEAQSSTLEEIIRKVPQLAIDADGNVLMNGQSNYKILVDGHASGAMSRNFSEVIRSMPAGSVRRIEVITNPSMKYDAEGAGGVLNIITARSRTAGFSGSVNTTHRFPFIGGYMTNNSVLLAVQSGKMTLSGSLYQSATAGTLGLTAGSISNRLENLTPDARYNLSNRTDYGMRFRNLYGNLQASYQLDPNNLLTAEFTAYDGASRTRQEALVERLDPAGDPLMRYKEFNRARVGWKGYDLGVNYEHTFGREKHTLTLSDHINLQPSPGSQNRTHTSTEALLGETAYGELLSASRSQSVSNELQIDYNNPLGDGRHALEAGLKHSYNFDKQLNGNTYDELLSTTGTSRLTKQIFALYAGYAWTTKVSSLRLGARLERASYELESDIGGTAENYTSRLTNVVPYASLTLTPAMGHALAMSYTQRLLRPAVSAMSPYVSESLEGREYGNPDLETGVNHTFNLRYTHFTNRWMFSLGTTFGLSNNLVAQYKFVDEDNLLNSTYENDGRMRSCMADMALSYRPSAKFNLAVSFSGGHSRYTMPNQGIVSSGWSYNQSFNATIGLWRGARLTLSEFMSQAPVSMSARWTRPFLYTGINLGQKFLQEKLELTLMMTSPLRRRSVTISRSETPTYNQSMRYENELRSLGFSLSWRFGKQRIAVKQTNRKADTTTESVGGSGANGGTGAAGAGGAAGGASMPGGAM